MSGLARSKRVLRSSTDSRSTRHSYTVAASSSPRRGRRAPSQTQPALVATRSLGEPTATTAPWRAVGGDPGSKIVFPGAHPAPLVPCVGAGGGPRCSRDWNRSSVRPAPGRAGHRTAPRRRAPRNPPRRPDRPARHHLRPRRPDGSRSTGRRRSRSLNLPNAVRPPSSPECPPGQLGRGAGGQRWTVEPIAALTKRDRGPRGLRGRLRERRLRMFISMIASAMAIAAALCLSIVGHLVAGNRWRCPRVKDARYW